MLQFEMRTRPLSKAHLKMSRLGLLRDTQDTCKNSYVNDVGQSRTAGKLFKSKWEGRKESYKTVEFEILRYLPHRCY